MRTLASISIVLFLFIPALLFAESASICSALRTLSRGDSGSDVTIVQQFLFGQGFFERQATGYFGPVTEAALTDFQMQKEIISTRENGGVFGPRTRAYIAKAYCGEAVATGARVPEIPISPELASSTPASTTPETYAYFPTATSSATAAEDVDSLISKIQSYVAELHASVEALQSCAMGSRSFPDGTWHTPTIEGGDCPSTTQVDASKCGRIAYQCQAGKWIEYVSSTTTAI